jgi:hypothetical protein
VSIFQAENLLNPKETDNVSRAPTVSHHIITTREKEGYIFIYLKKKKEVFELLANWKLGYFGGATRPAKRHAWLSQYITVVRMKRNPNLFRTHPQHSAGASVSLTIS